MPANLETQQWPQDWKRSVFIPISKKGNAKECSNYRTIALISHASKVMLKILQARLQQYVNREFLMFKLVLEKAEEPEIKLPNIRWIMEKAREFQKSIYFCFIDYAKAFDCVDHNKLWATVHSVAKSWTQLSDFTFTLTFKYLHHSTQQILGECRSFSVTWIPLSKTSFFNVSFFHCLSKYSL